ncbi:T9SS type A sorting domain-containing protein [Hymenobacter bucti]|uniref:T9SS type A sorting domain-containing protein n=1 Tax=Hymenobacter bucti TaxID=1844114 RepID=A0ABW4QSN7_9BACT
MRLTSIRLSLWLVGLLVGLSGQRAVAQVTAPSQGGEVSLEYATATTLTLNFGTTGNGQGRVLAIAESSQGAPVPLLPVDEHFYTANAAYGQGSALNSGFIVYNGAEHSVTVTGLKASTYYYFISAEYNTDGFAIRYNSNGISMSTATRKASTTSVPSPLPVELISFTGTVDAHDIATLHWSTASERNSAYFALERSLDGTTFTEAGRVAAATISSQTITYQWPDPKRLLSPTYYRLRQVDTNGTTQYSNVVTLAPAPTIAKLLEVYPNPSEGKVMQLLLQGYNDEHLTIRITDALGRTVATQRLHPASAQYLAPLALPPGLTEGTYVLTLAGSGSPIQKRIIVSY